MNSGGAAADLAVHADGKGPGGSAADGEVLTPATRRLRERRRDGGTTPVRGPSHLGSSKGESCGRGLERDFPGLDRSGGSAPEHDRAAACGPRRSCGRSGIVRLSCQRNSNCGSPRFATASLLNSPRMKALKTSRAMRTNSTSPPTSPAEYRAPDRWMKVGPDTSVGANQRPNYSRSRLLPPLQPPSSTVSPGLGIPNPSLNPWLTTLNP
jgi:hypothetical protein